MYERLLRSDSYVISLLGFIKPEVAYARVFTRALCTSLLGKLREVGVSINGGYIPINKRGVCNTVLQ